MAHDDANQVDVIERSRPRDGAPQEMDRRLFMQLLVFACEGDLSPIEGRARLVAAIEEARIPAVVYDDLSNPRGVALLTWNEDPTHFVGPVRTLLGTPALHSLKPQAGWTMTGRTYATGYEPDLEHTLLRRPIANVLNDAYPWAVWYPLRRRGSFEALEPQVKGAIVREHAVIGMAYGRAGHAHDVRLACHGMDPNDNEFVVGLVSANLHRLSHVVQTMRSTRQTSEYIEKMGPFFVGHAVWRSAGA
jgi:chlorite dismutase